MASKSFTPSEVLRTESSNICSKLGNSDESLLLFAGKLFDKSIIDRGTKADVRRTKGYEGADIMMDYLLTKLEERPDLFETIINLMKEVELLVAIATKLEHSGASGIPLVCTDGPRGIHFLQLNQKIMIYNQNIRIGACI